jgi:peptidyl-prolyl cis-trans isomerase A (cyclophilin A)
MTCCSAVSCVRPIIIAGAVAALPSLLAGFTPQTKPATSQPAATRPAASQPAASKPVTVTDNLVYVLVNTNKGDFVLELNHEKAPITVENFVRYVDGKFYDNTIFHRITKQNIFVIQGGGVNPDGSPKQGDLPIKNEWKNGLKNERGTISMARMGYKPDSATSQFFINVKDDSMLDAPNDGAAYAVFGRIVAGMSVIDTIFATPVKANPQMNNEVSQPTEQLLLKKAERISAEQAKKLMDAEKPPAATTKPATTTKPS